MRTTLERRIARLERTAGDIQADGELVELDELSDERKEILRAVLTSFGLTTEEVERRVNSRYFRRSACVARLNPVECQQRLLAIREGVKDHPAAWAFLTAALESVRASQSNS
jgi:hypothetical protein